MFVSSIISSMVSGFRRVGSRTRDDGRGESIDEFAHSGGNTRSPMIRLCRRAPMSCPY
jgi:hypothetical protein